MAWLKDRLNEPRLLVLPGVFDCLTAQLAARHSFEAIYCSGYVTAASGYGLPDLGLLSNSELLAVYSRIASASSLPLVVDADTGDGGVLNAQRSIRNFANSGISALHIEDQVSPKKCGHLSETEVVSREEAAARVRAAIIAGQSSACDIIWRTDALNSLGVEEAILRANMGLSLGATAVFIDGLRDIDLIKRVARQVNGPLVFNAAPFSDMPAFSNEELARAGVSVVLYPGDLICAAATAADERLRQLSDPRLARRRDRIGPEQINQLTAQADYLQHEQTLSEPLPAAKTTFDGFHWENTE